MEVGTEATERDQGYKYESFRFTELTKPAFTC